VAPHTLIQTTQWLNSKHDAQDVVPPLLSNDLNSVSRKAVAGCQGMICLVGRERVSELSKGPTYAGSFSEDCRGGFLMDVSAMYSRFRIAIDHHEAGQ
jgi:hypothetical protein